MKPVKDLLQQLIQYFIDWLVTFWREAKTTANLNEEIRKYKEATEELDPQPQPEFKENGVFGQDGWYIQLTNPVVTKEHQ